MVAVSTTMPVLTSTTPQTGPWWLALIISGMGAVGTAFGALLHFISTRRKDKMTAHDKLVADHRELSERLQREIGRLDAVCNRQQLEIDGKESRITIERRLKHECSKKLQQLQFEKDELMERLKTCGMYINELEFKLDQARTKNNA
jgi:chromosome segregation ATPase